MKIIDTCEQGSLEWHKLRAGIPTASEFDNLLTPAMKPRSWDTKMPHTFLAKKLAEAWSGGPEEIFVNTREMEFGKILEAEARGWVSLEVSSMVQQVAFCTTDDGRIGCSPDGLIDGQQGVEIKCPQEGKIHVRRLLDGGLPEDCAHQVHGSMYVTGFTSWRFVSYRRGFPNLMLVVERDEKIVAAIHEALQEFLTRFDAGMKLLEEKHGGPAPRNLWTPPPGFGAIHKESDEEHPQYVFDPNERVTP